MSAPFSRDGPCIFAHVVYTPIPRSDLRFFYFPLKIFGLRWSTFSEKILTDEKSGKKQTNKKQQVRSAHGHIIDLYNISRLESKKRRGHSPGNKFGVFSVN